MTHGPIPHVSRRQWLGAVSTPVAAAALVGAMPAFAAGAGPSTDTPDAKLAGVRVFNVRDFGAMGDGKANDTAAVQSAIDACTADHGGVVLVPAGDFLIAPIELKSNVTLRIAAGGTLIGTTDKSVYKPSGKIPIEGDHTMGDGNVGLLYAANAVNITLEGPGTIDGNGAAVRAAGTGGRERPYIALFYKCTNLTVRNIYLYRSAYHTLRVCNSSYVHCDGVTIFSRVTGNNDGFHFISAEYVNIVNCNVRCQDDACALFGSCRFIMITNSSFSTRWSVFRFGGGVAENIVVSNCILYDVFGCPIKLRCEPGSVYQNMIFSDLVLQNVSGPISIGAGPQRAGGGGGNAAGGGAIVRNISFHNITGTVVTQPTPLPDSANNVTGVSNPGEQRSCIILNCVPGNIIENISFSDIRLTFGGGGTAKDAATRDLPHIAAEYFALGPMPAYAFYARNARGVTLHNVRLETATPDLRPAVIFDHVTDAAITSLSAQANKDAESALRFINVTDTLVTSPRLLTPTAVFLRVEGAGNKGIAVQGGDVSKASTPVQYTDGASKDAVTIRA